MGLCPFVYKAYDIAFTFLDVIEIGLRCQYRHAIFLNPQVLSLQLFSRRPISQDPCELTIGILAIELVLEFLRKRDGRALDVFDCRRVRIVRTRCKGTLHVSGHIILTIYNLFTWHSVTRHAWISHGNIILQVVLVVDFSLGIVVSNNPKILRLRPFYLHILVLQRIPLLGVTPTTVVELPCLTRECQAINLVALELIEVDDDAVPINSIASIIRLCNFIFCHVILAIVLPNQHRTASVHRELKLSTCHVVERIVALAIACRRIGYSVTIGRVDNPDNRVEVSLRIDHGAFLHFPFYRILRCVV